MLLLHSGYLWPTVVVFMSFKKSIHADIPYNKMRHLHKTAQI